MTTQPDNKLMPCPFCGGEVRLYFYTKSEADTVEEHYLDPKQEYPERRRVQASHSCKAISTTVSDMYYRGDKPTQSYCFEDWIESWNTRLQTSQASGWRPIAEAPDDLKQALITGGTYTWDDGYGDEPMLFVTLAYRHYDGDWRRQANGHDKEFYYQPTHFMELPNPPSEAK